MMSAGGVEIGDNVQIAPQVTIITTYRLVYRVVDDELIVLILAVGKREKNEAYLMAQRLLKK